MALYKEVQVHYENGLKIPDDVTLLFADDNFGTLRRLPTKEERARKGGAGVCSWASIDLRWLRANQSKFYYHFQYTGDPRSYRWMNSNTLVI